MTDTVPVAQWITLQAEVNTLQRENRELQAEVRRLMDEKMAWMEEKAKTQHGAPENGEQKYSSGEEMRETIFEKFYDYPTGQFGLIPLFNYCRTHNVPSEVVREVLAFDHRESVVLPDNLLELIGTANAISFFESIVFQLPQRKDIVGHFYSLEDCYMQYKQGKVPLEMLRAYGAGFNTTRCELTKDAIDAIQSAGLSVSDYLTTVLPLLPQVTGLSLPDDLNTLVGDANVKEVLEATLAALPNLKSITGYFKSLEDCYTQYKQGNVPRKILEAYCAGDDNTTYKLTADTIGAIQSAELSVAEYLATVLPLLPKVTTLQLPTNLNSLIKDGKGEEVFKTAVSSLPELDCITGYFSNVENCYVQYKQGHISLEVLRAYAKGCVATTLDLSPDATPYLQSAGLSVLDYLSTVIPHLPTVSHFILPDNLIALIGNDNVVRFFKIFASSPRGSFAITGYFRGLEDCYVQYTKGDVPLEVLKACCAACNTGSYQLTQEAVKTVQSAGLSVSEYLSTVVPLMSGTFEIRLNHTDITTLDWCEAVVPNINQVDISGCPNIRDFTPLLWLEWLREVKYDKHTNRPFSAVKDQLKSKGVTLTKLN
ncbi:hypothetical protein ADEAN_000193000 [Angomonas deanei]|uniref:Uncharacterized protein n=1 Tax=Angomonas deanei TaxID=59799 RepID=A0A7G2C6U2_9TRYP|nr:hypothetical protein ADEAN_000193000 [Angomonas deanei]